MKKAFVFLLIFFSALAIAGCGDGECIHSFGEPEILLEARCETPGIESVTCEKCGFKRENGIEPLGHTEQILASREASCSETGLTEGASCTLCGKILRDQTLIPLQEHQPIVTLEALAPTCTAEGHTESAECSVCGAAVSTSEIVPATGHIPLNYPEVIPTCISEGRTAYANCSACKEQLSAPEYFRFTDHTYKDGRCSYCGDYENHTLGLDFGYRGNDDRTRKDNEIKGMGTSTDKDLIFPAVMKIFNSRYLMYGIFPRAFQGNKNITSITFPDTYVCIGTDAFRDCTSLEKVTLGKGMKVIYKNAFNGCTSLREVVAAESLEEINLGAFQNCTSLERITLGKVHSISMVFHGSGLIEATVREFYDSSSAFAECKRLNKVTLGNEDAEYNIGISTFRSCPALTDVTLLGKVKEIQNYAFEGCSSLKSIDIGDSATALIAQCFMNCTSLSSFTIPKSMTMIGPEVFAGCTSLKSINYEGTMEEWEKIEIHEDWCRASALCEIICTDGTIKIG